MAIIEEHMDWSGYMRAKEPGENTIAYVAAM
jgi:hypothetical protein